MSFFRMNWLRRFVRRHTTPIPYRKAHKYRNYLSLAYAFCTWNMLAYIGYEYYNGRGTKQAYGVGNPEYDMLSSSQKTALALGIEKAKIVRSSNMSETIEFKREDYEHLFKKPETKDDEDEDNVA